MKNKFISMSLVVALLSTTVVNATVFEPERVTGNSAGTWTDPSDGRKYYSGGSAVFRFKKSVTNFKPWVSGRAPSLNAGCGGVSLDGGFASFLDMEEIGDQLEQAVSSVGMGVVVVLLQTMPSIAKAFEDIQKLVRKLQSMLANACQSTVSFLKENETAKKATDSIDSAMNAVSPDTYWNMGKKGIADKLNAQSDELKCDADDTDCLANLALMTLGIGSDDKTGKGGMLILAADKEVAKDIIGTNSSTSSDACPVEKDDLNTVLKEGKFIDTSLKMSSQDRTAVMIRHALFGTLAIPFANALSMTANKEKHTHEWCTKAGKAEAKKVLEEVAKAPTPSTFAIQYYPRPKANDNKIVQFLTGMDANGTVSLEYETGFSYVLVSSSDESKPDSGGSGPITHRVYLESNEDYNHDTDTISWTSLEKRTMDTIMSYLDPENNPAVADPVGIYIPNGGDFLQIIHKYANHKDYRYYAQELARINTKYAILGLISQAKDDAMAALFATKDNEGAVNNYLETIKGVEKTIKEKLDNYSGDFEKLNAINEHFQSIKRKELEKRERNKR